MRNVNSVVAAVKEQYPGFDHSLWSKCQRPAKYGIGLCAGAKLLADEALGKRRKRDRRKGHTLSWRSGEALLERLQTVKKALGIVTFQEVITVAIIKLCEEVEAKA